jgi:DNA topoisomerase-3
VIGDENVDLVKSIYEKLKDEYSDLSAGCDENNLSGSNKRLFNSAELSDHHALIPLDKIPSDASENEKGVYRIVLERFFTTLKPQCVYNSVKYEADIAGFKFAGSGIETIEEGWKKGLQGDDEDGENTDSVAGIEEGKIYPLSAIKNEEKFTEPKKHYTFSSVLTLMENPRGGDGAHLTGLGTPATRGNILDKLFLKKYLELKGKNILITEEGKFLVGAIKQNPCLLPVASVPETTRWEELLCKDTAAFLDDIKSFVKTACAGSRFEKIERKKDSLGKCPACQGEVYEGKTNYYCSNYNEKG